DDSAVSANMSKVCTRVYRQPIDGFVQSGQQHSEESRRSSTGILFIRLKMTMLDLAAVNHLPGATLQQRT
ncbi:MAG: hypothetical protein KDE58_30465, partial [Caldilineaceae bacterium]|nr:hypothetical protein [Caldilineaceae bacterium]